MEKGLLCPFLLMGNGFPQESGGAQPVELAPLRSMKDLNSGGNRRPALGALRCWGY